MYRFAVAVAVAVALFLAIGASAQTLSEAMPLTATVARTPSFRNTTGLAAARAGDGFVVAWKEDSVVRMKRLSPHGDLAGEWAMETWDELRAVGANGDEALVSLGHNDDRQSTYVRIHADGHLTTVPAQFAAWSLVPFGDGYLGRSNDGILRLDLDGRVVASHDTGGRGTLVAANDRTLLLWAELNVLHASTIGSDFTISPGFILSDQLTWSAPVYATADPSGELAIATTTVTGLAVLFFDAQLRGTGRVVLPAPSGYSFPIASSGNGYVLVVPESDHATIVTIDAQRRLATPAVIPNTRVTPVSGVDGALIAFQTKTAPSNAQFVMAGGSHPPLPPRLLADAEPDQRWPRVARLGDRVVIAWDESTGKQTALMAAIFDPKERRIVAGPVEVARDYANARGDELAVASDGRNIAIAWSTDTESQLVLLSPDLQTVATRFLSYDERVHDVVWDGSAYVVAQGWKELAISRWDSTLKGLGSFSLGVDSVNGYWWVDGRLLLGTTDVLLLAHNWYQLLCYCGEGPWHIAVQRLSRFDTPSSWPQTLATLELGDVKRKMSGFARAGDHLLFFFPQRTEVRALDTLALLTTLPNDALPSELPYASLGQAAVVGNQIVGTFGNLIEFFELDGTPVSTLPLDDTANDSQFAAGTPFVIVNDALASSGSRRIHLRLLDLDLPLPHRRAAAH